jgi:DNA-binding response OmpR family regulator
MLRYGNNIMRIKKILIIDDDMDYINELEEYLIQEKYYILKKNDTDDILSFIKDNKPDLVILDFKINGLTGFDVNILMKNDEQTKDIPIILVSNYYDDTDNNEHLLKSGIRICLKKSIEPERLIYEIRKIEMGQ